MLLGLGDLALEVVKVTGPFRGSVGGLRTDGLGALAGDGGY